MEQKSPLSRLRAAVNAVSFTQRLSTASRVRDERTAAAAAPYLPPRAGPHLDSRMRLLKEAGMTRMEDAGVYESRLGLKQRSREPLTSPKSLLSASPSSASSASPTSAMSPIPARRKLGSSAASRAPAVGSSSKAVGAFLRSPIASERRLGDDPAFDDDDSEEAQDKLIAESAAPLPAPLKRAQSLSAGGIAMSRGRDLLPQSPGTGAGAGAGTGLGMSVATGSPGIVTSSPAMLLRVGSVKVSSPAAGDMKMKALRAIDSLKAASRPNPGSPSPARSYRMDPTPALALSPAPAPVGLRSPGDLTATTRSSGSPAVIRSSGSPSTPSPFSFDRPAATASPRAMTGLPTAAVAAIGKDVVQSLFK